MVSQCRYYSALFFSSFSFVFGNESRDLEAKYDIPDISQLTKKQIQQFIEQNAKENVDDAMRLESCLIVRVKGFNVS